MRFTVKVKGETGHQPLKATIRYFHIVHNHTLFSPQHFAYRSIVSISLGTTVCPKS